MLSSDSSWEVDRGKSAFIDMHTMSTPGIWVGWLKKDALIGVEDSGRETLETNNFSVAVLYKLYREESNLWLYCGEHMETGRRDQPTHRSKLVCFEGFNGSDVACLFARHLQACTQVDHPGHPSLIVVAGAREELCGDRGEKDIMKR